MFRRRLRACRVCRQQLAEYVKYAVTDLPNHYKIRSNRGDEQHTGEQSDDRRRGDARARVVLRQADVARRRRGMRFVPSPAATGFPTRTKFSTGFDGQLTGRHSMGITNAVYYANGKAFWDERAASLEDQALQPIQSPVEMGMTLPALVAKLSQTDFYPVLFQAAFGSPEITPEKIGKAIAQFERSMVSYKSKYDAAIAAGQNGQPNLEHAHRHGNRWQALFHGSGRCSQCHTTNAQVGDTTHNIGLELTNDCRRWRGRRQIQDDIAAKCRGPRPLHARRPVFDVSRT